MHVMKPLFAFLSAATLSVVMMGCSDGASGDKVIGTDAAEGPSDADASDGENAEEEPAATESEESGSAEGDAQDFQVESGFTTGLDSIGTRYTAAGARLTNPNADLAAYGVQVLFNLVAGNGDVLDSGTETVAYVGPGETVPVAPLQIGFDLKQKPAKLEVQVVGEFTVDNGPQDAFGAESAILTMKSAGLVQSEYSRELSAQVTNPTDEVVTDATWDCIFVNGDKIAGGASSAIVDPIPPGATVQFGDFISLEELEAKKVECRVVTGF